MNTSVAGRVGGPLDDMPTVEASTSAVSWPAVFAGAIVAACASLILIALGSGLGFASISPWAGRGASATTFTVMTAIGLIVVQWIASALGGYVTGRLRTKWTRTHTHEVFFRDTAHGLLTWGLATLISAFVLASAVSTLIGAGADVVGTAASGAAQGAANSAATAVSPYDVDTLFRSAKSETPAGMADRRPEAMRIFAHAAATGELAATDREYLAEVIATRTGISQDEAGQRVDAAQTQIMAAEAKAKAAADAARKTTAEASLYTALSLLIGAFVAMAAAALGGRLRDEQV